MSVHIITVYLSYFQHVSFSLILYFLNSDPLGIGLSLYLSASGCEEPVLWAQLPCVISVTPALTSLFLQPSFCFPHVIRSSALLSSFASGPLPWAPLLGSPPGQVPVHGLAHLQLRRPPSDVHPVSSVFYGGAHSRLPHT